MPRFANKPSHLRVKVTVNETFLGVKAYLREKRLCTVCVEAHCPNLHSCWGSGTATFMLLGDVCTRHCSFCAVKSGRKGATPDPHEPAGIAEATRHLGLRYVVLTSVARDDLEDDGARLFADTIRAIRGVNPDARVEALIPDFGGRLEALAEVCSAQPDVVGHNLETVEPLSPQVRDPRAGYRLTLSVLKAIKELDSRILTKSSLLLGLGENEAQLLRAMGDLREASVDMLVLGQYLQPSPRHPPPKEFIPPERFEHLRRRGEELGFRAVVSEPLARTSYRAGEYFFGVH